MATQKYVCGAVFGMENSSLDIAAAKLLHNFCVFICYHILGYKKLSIYLCTHKIRQRYWSTAHKIPGI